MICKTISVDDCMVGKYDNSLFVFQTLKYEKIKINPAVWRDVGRIIKNKYLQNVCFKDESKLKKNIGKENPLFYVL